MTNSNSKFWDKPAITTDFCAGMDVAQKLSLAAQHGFGSVMLNMNIEPDQPSAREQIQLCKKYGLDICCVHLPFDMNQHTINANLLWQRESTYFNFIADSLALCGKFGISIAVFHLTSGKVFPDPNDIGLERLERLTDIAKSNGVFLALENKRATDHNVKAFERINNDHLAFCYDIGHENIFQPNSMLTSTVTKKNPMVMIHLHDNNGREDLHQLPFDGSVDFDKIKHNLIEANYCNNLMLECRKELSTMYNTMSVEDFVVRAYQSAIRFQNLFKTNTNER